MRGLKRSYFINLYATQFSLGFYLESGLLQQWTMDT